MCGEIPEYACFNDVCTGESSETREFLTKSEQFERLTASYVRTGDHDLDAHNVELIGLGMPPVTAEKFRAKLREATDAELKDTAVRTRYAAPGQRSGRGYVRLLSSRQVAFIKRLMTERDTSKLVRLPGSEDIEKMSLAGARDLITRLLCCPELANKPVRGASDKQLEWLRKQADKVTTNEYVIDIRDRAIAGEFVSLTEAKSALDVLFALPWPRHELTVTNKEPITEGLYRLPDGRIVKVRTSRSSGRLYGLVWNLFDEPEPTKKGLKYGEFVYAQGIMRELSAEHRMTLEDAKAFGIEFHFCIRCGIELTNPESIDAGIGPICAKKF